MAFSSVHNDDDDDDYQSQWQQPEGAARARANGNGNGNAARLLICPGQPTVPYLADNVEGEEEEGVRCEGVWQSVWAWHMSVQVQCSWQMFADLNLN